MTRLPLLISSGLLLWATACSQQPQQNAMTPTASTFGDHVRAQTAYLNGLSPAQGWQSLPNGLRYRRISGSGTGPKPKATDTVKLNYTGTLIDGTEFDSSRGTPVEMALPDLIPGWQVGVPLMSVGDRYEFAVPPTLGYGPNDMGPIPGGSALLFTIDLVAIAPSG